jgi:hypothetical protein
LKNNSIIKLSFEKDKNKSVHSHKREILKNNLQFCKVRYMITPSVKDSDMTNRHFARSCEYISLFIVENQLNSTGQKDNLVNHKSRIYSEALGLCNQMAPVESFEGSSTGTSC